ncbi:MAG: ABC transporter ATP-binding protein [Bryobacteraceae bacterium]
MTPDILLSTHLSVDYRQKPGVLRDCRLGICEGEIFGLAGQSGSGKSTIALALLGLLEPGQANVRGEILFEDRNLIGLPEEELRALRGNRISLVLQSPIASLNPRLRLATQFQEAWKAHVVDRPEAWKEAVLAALESVSLPADEAFLRLYPRELSVGIAQRVLIAMAILHGPKLLIADEATSALDVITQSEILELFQGLNRSLGMSILYITHDLRSAGKICDRMGILYEGQMVECGPTRKVLERPTHPYTQRLMAALVA